MRKLWPSLVALGLVAIFTIWAYPQLPADITTHWGLDGQPNAWSSPVVAVLLLPGIVIGIAVVLLLAPAIDPRKESWELHAATYWQITNLVLCVLLSIHVLVLGNALGWPLPINRVIPVVVGLLFVLMGNYMPRFRPNWFIGIRTPWTLSSDSVWRQTHRIGGVCLMVAGVLVAAMGLVNAGPLPLVLLSASAGCVIVPVTYSWVLWRRETQAHPGPQT
ncbi:MAG: SdpI family protein [Gemmatimonadota bacterium]